MSSDYTQWDRAALRDELDYINRLKRTLAADSPELQDVQTEIVAIRAELKKRSRRRQ